MMLDNVCPCRDCVAPKRHAGCHGHCEEYKTWDNARKQELDKIRSAKNAESDYTYMCVQRHARAIKRSHKNGNN